MTNNEAIVTQENEIKDHISQLYKKIGELYYTTKAADPEPAFEALVSEVTALNEKLSSLAANDAVGCERKCHVCGTPLEKGFAFCSQCGARAKEESVPAPAPAPAPAPIAYKKLVCAYCGAPIPPDAAFCLNCGKPVGESSVATGAPVPPAPVVQADEDYEVGATTVLSPSLLQDNEDYEVGATTVLSPSLLQNDEDYEVGATTVLSPSLLQNDDEDYEVGATTVLSWNVQPKESFYARCTCGEAVVPGTEFCPKCGARTTKVDVDGIQNSVPAGYARCTNCGELVLSSEPYCTSCGFRMGKSRREM